MPPKQYDSPDIDKLIEMVKDRPAIYNYSCTAHKNKEYIDILWKEIAEALNITITLCKAKWLALRNSYSREIRNENKFKANPYGRKRRRKWYLAEDMTFLREYLNYGHQKRNAINDEHEDDDDDDDDEVDDDYTTNSFDDETCSSQTAEKVETKYNAITKEENEIQLEDSIPSQSTTAFETLQKTPLAAAKPAENPIEDPLFKEYGYSKRMRQEEISELQEQNMTFFKSILPDILKLSERRQRVFKQEVLSVLNNSLDEQEMGS